MSKIKEIHDYLYNLPETGKVLSLGAVMKLAEKLNQGQPLDNFDLALLYNEIPETFKNMMLKPFVSIENDQVRFSVRIKDSEKTLRRNELLKKIKADLINDFGLKENNLHLTGMLVLYNNMLQSLFGSQILTLGAVAGWLTCQDQPSPGRRCSPVGASGLPRPREGSGKSPQLCPSSLSLNT